MTEAKGIFTIGHSNHSAETFVSLLRWHGITALADVRSAPYSRLYPHFNRESLRPFLKGLGISYVFLGHQLGARTADASCYLHGRVQYERLAQTANFQHGLRRVLTGAATHRIALMCAEQEPLECHRTILISRYLEKLGCRVTHILANGHSETHVATLQRLAHMLPVRSKESHLFRSYAELEADLYRLQEQRIAYRMTGLKDESTQSLSAIV